MSTAIKAFFTACLAIVLSACSQQTAPEASKPRLSGEKVILALRFEMARNAPSIDRDIEASRDPTDARTWLVQGLPARADLSRLIPSFALSAGASLSTGGKALISGESMLSFEAPIELVVSAEDGSSSTERVVVSRLAPSSSREVLSLEIAAPRKGSLSSAPAISATCPGFILPSPAPGNGGTIAIHAPALDLTQARLNLRLSPRAIATLEGRAITSDAVFTLRDGMNLRVAAEDGSASEWLIRVYELSAASIAAYAPPATAGSPSWIDVLIRRKAELAAAKLVLIAPGSDEILLADFAAMPEFAKTLDGDCLRLWAPSCLISPSGLPGRVDLETRSALPPPAVGALLVSLESERWPISILPLSFDAGSWFAAGDAGDASVPAATESGTWETPGREGAIDARSLNAMRETIALVNAAPGRSSRDYTREQGRCAVSITSRVAGIANQGRGGRLDLEAVADANGGADVRSAEVDLSSLGLSASMSMAARASAWGLSFDPGAALAAGSYTAVVKARCAIEGAAVFARRETPVEILPPRSLALATFSAAPAIVSTRAMPRVFSLRAIPEARNGAKVSSVCADLSGLGGPLSASLAADASGAWSVDVPVTAAIAAGPHEIPVTARDEESALTATAHAIVSAWNPAFAHGDMEDGGPAGLPAKASLDMTAAFEGAAALHYAGATSSSALVALSTEKLTPPPGATKLVFWFKGRSSGTAPGLRIQLGSGGSFKCYYDLNGIVAGTPLVLKPGSGGTYPTREIDVPEWTRVELELAGLVVSATAGDSLANYPFQVRVRAGGNSDWFVDFFHFE